MTPIPRWFQKEAAEAPLNWDYKNKGNPLIVCPTGGGKTHILGYFCQQVLSRWPGQQILVLSRRTKIIEQNVATIQQYLPHGEVGVFAASLNKKQRRSVTVGSIGTVANNVHFFRGITIVLVDECHEVPVASTGQYRHVLEAIGAHVIGLTATPFRLGGGYLYKGEQALFGGICYEIDILTLLQEGYLTDLVCKDVRQTDNKLQMRTDGVRKAGGDFVTKALAEEFDRQELTARICDDLALYRDVCKKWLIFAIDIKHAENIAELLTERGIRVGTYHSKLSKSERHLVESKFNRGDLQSLVSVESLTTGYDCPEVDLVGVLRPTQSPVLHIQLLGRGLRVVYADWFVHGGADDNPEGRRRAIAEGPKPVCIVRDYAGNISRLGPINDVTVKEPGKKKKKGNPITKTCPKCYNLCAGSAKFCSCGHEFTFREKIKTIATKASPIKKPNEWVEVAAVHYGIYVNKRTSIRTLHVVYYDTSGNSYAEYKRFDAGSNAHIYASRWWRKNAVDPTSPVPQDVDSAYHRAMNRELYAPTHILVDKPKGKRYYNVTQTRRLLDENTQAVQV